MVHYPSTVYHFLSASLLSHVSQIKKVAA